jgi:transcriptional regulator with XRE-family HTH domain
MKKRSTNCVRESRLRWGLSTKDLSKLLGRHASTVSRLERRETTPTLRAAFGCEVVFGVPPEAMFPSLYEGVEEVVMARAARLYASLEGRTDRRSVRLKKLLDEMVKRAKGNADVA